MVWRLAALMLMAVALAACGGGDDSPSPTATLPPAATSTPGAATLPLRPDQQALYAVNADGTGLRELYAEGDYVDFRLSPDG